MKKKIFIAVFKAILIAIGMLLLFFGYVIYSLPMCGNEIYSVVISPNKKHKAVLFQRDCGATTRFSTQLSVVEADGELENDAGNIFIIDGHPDSVGLKIEWASDSELVVYHPMNGFEHKAATTFGWFNKISIVYKSGRS